jgi:phage terminase small subunit
MKELNARQEKFAQLVGILGLLPAEACQQAGYAGKSAHTTAPRLLQNAAVASRIDTLKRQQQAKLEATAEGKVLSRAAILLALSNLAEHGKAEHTKLKALELLSKLQGYNEPERAQVQHLHMHVDAGLIEQLRAGYSALTARQASVMLQEGRPNSEALQGPVGAQSGATPPIIKGTPPTPAQGDS